MIPEPVSGRPVARGLLLTAVVALVAVLVVRLLGPSDLWDQTQPKTVSYTTDIVAHGRWMLPIERGEHPATKPPLYNWIAAPAVALFGYASEPAHKIPSMLALLGCWWLVLVAGRRIAPDDGLLTGAMAALMLAVNYPMFKLGYLARPDMLLTLWLVLGWYLVTRLYAADAGDSPGASRRDRWLALGFWACVAAAGLTKGPSALGLVLYGIVAARWVGGRWTGLGRLGWWWGLPLGLGGFALWVLIAWCIDPDHVRTLWSDELVGRITGEGPEGSGKGPLEILIGLPTMAVYFLMRFLPWSLPALLAIVVLWRRTAPAGPRRWTGLGEPGRWLHGAAIYVLITISLYSLSSGKRADYIASGYAPGALLAAWWIINAWGGRVAANTARVAAVLTLVAMGVFAGAALTEPVRGYGDAITGFARAARARIETHPDPAVFWGAGSSQLQALVGASERDGADTIRARFDTGEPFWAFVGCGRVAADEAVTRFTDRCRRRHYAATETLRSERLPRSGAWPGQVILFRAVPDPGEIAKPSRKGRASKRR